MQHFSKCYICVQTVLCVPCRFQRSFVLLKVLCGDNRTSYHKLWWARLYICVTKNVSTFHQTMAALALFSLYPCKEQHDNHKVWWASKTWLYIVSPTCLHSAFFFHRTASALFSYTLTNPLKLWCARPNPIVHLCHQNFYTALLLLSSNSNSNSSIL